MVREPARTAREAQDRYKRIISLPLSCITPALWYTGPATVGLAEDMELRLTVWPKPLRLRRDRLPPVHLEALQRYRVIPDRRYEGEWKVETLGYWYTIHDTQEHEPVPALAWHWHPRTGTIEAPHMHVYRQGDVGGVPLGRLHLPSERVAFESVVAFLIEELGVQPIRDDWKELIAAALARFVAFRTWGTGGPAPT